MRRRLRRRPAPRKALTPKSAIGKALGSSRLGGFALSFCFRLVPLGKAGVGHLDSAWKGGYRPRSYRGWVGGTLYPSSAPAGAPAAPGRSASPCFAAESARGGTLMSLPEGIATPAPARPGASRGGAVSSVVTSGCPKRSEGGFPVGTRTIGAPHAQNMFKREMLLPYLQDAEGAFSIAGCYSVTPRLLSKNA